MNDFFKVLADETRLRCLALIASYDELCVCELNITLALPQSKISRHLAIMKLNQLVRQRRQGQWMYYALHPDLTTVQREIIKLTVQAVQTQSPFKEDHERYSCLRSNVGTERV